MLSKIKKIIKYLIIYIRSFYFNLKCFDLSIAIKMPIIINCDVELGIIKKGSIKIKSKEISFGMIKLGFNGSKFISTQHSRLSITNDGIIFFEKKCCIAEGFNIYVDGGIVSFGNNFFSNKNFQIQCQKKISIGSDCLFGWNVCLRDTNGHFVYESNIKKEQNGNIVIGKHNWITSDVKILKNAVIKNNSIVACGSIICGLKSEENGVLIGGIPGKIIKNNINWEE